MQRLLRRRAMIPPLAIALAAPACWTSGASVPAAPGPDDARPAVDLERVRAAIRGAWSKTQHDDASTTTRTLSFGPVSLVRSKTSQRTDGTMFTSSSSTAPYRITEHGALAFSPTSGEEVRFTAIVVDRTSCRALLGTRCRLLGWGGFLAQTPAQTVYRREYDHHLLEPTGERRTSFVSTLTFAHSPRELAGPGAATGGPAPCRFDLAVTASAIVGGLRQRAAERRFTFDCDVTPNAKGSLARLVVRGFAAEPSAASSAWRKYIDAQHLLDGYALETQGAFGIAFQPVLYFDPADPRQLYFEQPGTYSGELDGA